MFKSLLARIVLAAALLVGAQIGVGENSQFHYGTARAAGWLPLGGPPAPAVSMDFADGYYLNGTSKVALTTLLSVTNSGGYCKDPNPATGLLPSFSSNTLRICPGYGLLVEEARTNLEVQSQTFDNGSWTKTQAAATADQINAPDGTLTADLITESGASGVLVTGTGATVVNGSTYNANFYVKRNNCDWVRMGMASGSGLSNGAGAWFNVATGVVGSTGGFGTGWSASGPQIQALPNGWYRISVNVATGAVAGSLFIRTASADASATLCNVGGGAGVGSAYYVWGAQEELGSFPTSYIATTTTAVTRNADTVSGAGALSSTLIALERTAVIRLAPVPNLGAGVIALQLSTNGQNLGAYIRNSLNQFTVRAANVDSTTTLGSGTATTASGRYGSSWGAAGTTAVANNGQIATSTNVMAPSAANFGANAFYPNTYYQRLDVWASRLADTQLAQLTAPDQVYADFASNTCQVNNATVDCNTLASNTNSTGGYVTNADGSMTNIGPNLLRIGAGVGLLSENTITNLITFSQAYDNAAWTASAMTATGDTTIAPDGTLTADTLTTSANGAIGHSVSTPSFSTTNGSTYSCSFILKSGTAQYHQLTFGSGNFSGAGYVNFDLVNGVQTGSGGTFISTSITPLISGWYRVSISAAATTTNSGALCGMAIVASASSVRAAAGPANVTTYAWGAQVEANTVPTSYFPTTTTALARSSDAIVTAGQLDAALKAPQGSAYMRMLPSGSSGNSPIVLGGSGSGYYFRATGSTAMASRLSGASTNSVAIGNGLTWAAFPTRMAIGWDTTVGLSAAANGAISSTTNTLTMPAGSIGIGTQAGTTTNSVNASISNITAYGYRLSDAVLQQMSQPDPIPAVTIDMTSANGCSLMTSYGPAATPCAGLLSNSNSTGGFATNADGSLTSFAPNTLRYGLGNGQLIEPAVTNLILQSQTLQTTWTIDNGTITSDALAAPDGTITADLYNEDNATTLHGIRQNVASIAASTTYTQSIYLKYAGRQWIRLATTGGTSANGNVWFDVQNCLVGANGYSVGTFVSASAIGVANGFCRVSATVTTAASASTTAFGWTAASANSSSATTIGLNGPSFYAWGAQVEALSYPSSYVATTTIPGARSADVTTLAAGQAAMNALGGAQGSVLVKTAPIPNIAGSPLVLAISGSTVYWSRANNNTAARSRTSAVDLLVGLGGGTNYTANFVKTMTTWDASGRSLAANGTQPAGTDGLSLGGQTNAIVGGSGTIGTYLPRLDFYNFRLPDATATQKTLPTLN